MSLKRIRKPSVMHAVGDQTPAVRHHIATMGGTLGHRAPTRRRKRSSSPKSSAPRKTRHARKTGGRLAKGSAAAKAWGKKMKRARKKA